MIPCWYVWSLPIDKGNTILATQIIRCILGLNCQLCRHECITWRAIPQFHPSGWLNKDFVFALSQLRIFLIYTKGYFVLNCVAHMKKALKHVGLRFCVSLAFSFQSITLQRRHNERDVVSNHQPHDRLLKRLFRCRSKKTSKLRVTGLSEGNSPVTGEFPAQRASDAENVSIWWRHHVQKGAWFGYGYQGRIQLLLKWGRNINSH